MKFKLFWMGLCLTFAQGICGQIAPGQTDTTDVATCFDFMGTVNFSSTYRWITSYTGPTAPDDWTGGLLNPNTNRMVDFSIPLVADLDGDGYPEIIGLGVSGTGGSTGYYNNIQIYNGQTGEMITKLYLPGTGNHDTYYYYHSSYHGSPCPMAIVDSDRDGIKELIFAFPNNNYLASSSYCNKLVSLELIPQKSNDITTDYTLNEKWQSTANYNADLSANYHKPLPTVVDLDGDGKAEVVVYNRIYNAATGALLSSLEGSSSFIGGDEGAYNNDDYLGFNYVYDMDLDGIYDIVAGGKIYKMPQNMNGTFSPTTITMTGVPDGRTGVADINGDGSPDVVVVKRLDNDDIRIVVWNPNFSNGGNSSSPTILADRTFMHEGYTGAAFASNSYVFIGDIDGRVQQTTDNQSYRLPEIAILSGPYSYVNSKHLTVHPNVAGISTADGGFPTTGTTAGEGAIVAVTWDANPGVSKEERLKLSFILEHDDPSRNTGFTMFDFDNDAQQEICYRDEKSLRIIKPIKPLIKNTATAASNGILFKQAVISYTGFEYPVIADIDNDASAEIIVTGRNANSGAYYYAYIYAVGPKNDKFAPALGVWNQYMYDPFKIKADSLTTPIGPAPNRLSPEFTYNRVVRNAEGTIIKTAEGYQPYNATIMQDMRFKNTPGTPHGSIEPIIFLTEAYIVTTGADKPTITGTNTTNGKITLYVGNKSTAETDVNANTPISIYQNSVSKANFVKKVSLSGCGFTGGSIQAGQTAKIEITGGIDPTAIYILRLGDDSDLSGINEIWRFGLNPPATNNTSNQTGPSSLAFRDCDWSDQEIKVAQLVANDDIYTIQEHSFVDIDLLANDIIPADASINIREGLNGELLSGPVAGDLTWSGNVLRYTHNAKTDLTDGIESFQYQISYMFPGAGAVTTRTATVYIYILQSEANAFVSCYGDNYLIQLKELPGGVQFYWSSGFSTKEETTPHSSLQLSNIVEDTIFYIRPVPTAAPYNGLSFPRGKLHVSVVPEEIDGKRTILKWTGAASTNWFDPNNWTDNDGNAVTYSPSNCTDVILSEGKSRYPTLNRPGIANNIYIKNRAMLGNTFQLTYEKAAFELKLKAKERNRLLMYSAPFGKTYSGDFMLRGKDGYPIKKAVYMSFFQATNPDNSSETATAYHFTQSFSKEDEELTLGKGFILSVDGTQDTGDTSFQFPSPVDQYEYYYDDEYIDNLTTPPQAPLAPFSGVLDRGNPEKNSRFIAEMSSGGTYSASGYFDLTIPNDLPGSKLLMLVNPFNSFLSVDSVLVGNATVLEAGRYYIWDGSEISGFISFQKAKNQWVVGNPDALPQTPSPLLIPPYQAIFVLKKNPGSMATVRLSENWTTTDGVGYELRSGHQTDAGGEENAWYLNVSSGELAGRTALFASEETTHTPALFFDGDQAQSLDIYVIDKQGKAVSITGFSAEEQEVQLGLRLKQSGEIEMDLQGLDTDGYQVYLKDEDQLIDLSDGKKYKTTIVRPVDANKTYFEVNDRFSLLIKKN
jgi:hypothetical protein